MLSLKQIAPRWVKRPALRLMSKYRRAIWPYRKATSSSRSLPDFIIIGAQKSGTSSLYLYLGQHPQLLPSLKKEIRFFDGGYNPNIDNFEKGQAWYRAHFPFRKNVGTHSRTFEASSITIFNPLTPRRIFDLVPEVKLIAVLRNPTERAISHYFHEKRRGRESLPIMEALQKEEIRLEPVIENKDYKSDHFIHHSYKSRGLYRQQIERFLKYFPWKQILVLSSEELFCEPDKTLKQVFEFVGVDTGFKAKDLRPRNVANNRSEVDPKVYKYLDNYFLSHNQALYELVGKYFEW